VLSYVVQNSLLWKGGKKYSKNAAPFPPPKKKKKFLDLTKRGKSNCIGHRQIIQVLAVVGTITTTIIMTVNTEACIPVFLFLSRRMGPGSRSSGFDCSIDLSCWAIIMVESWGEL